jgi:hypothetical protein
MSRLRLLLPIVLAVLFVTAISRVSALPIREWANYGSSSSIRSSAVAKSYPSVTNGTISSVSSAQSSTGAVIPEDPLITSWKRFAVDRGQRTRDFRAKYLVFRKQEVPFYEAIEKFYTYRNDLREQCREDLRRANRDMMFEVELRCFRAELSEYRDMLRRQQDFYNEMPGISERIRRDAMQKHVQLIDAVHAIIYAIDGDVFMSSEELLEAKKGLREKYQKPGWDALDRLRIHRDITWMGHLLLRFDPAIQEDVIAFGEARPDWTTYQRCLMETEIDLRTLVDATRELRETNLWKVREKMQLCIQELQTLTPPVDPNANTGATINS